MYLLFMAPYPRDPVLSSSATRAIYWVVDTPISLLNLLMPHRWHSGLANQFGPEGHHRLDPGNYISMGTVAWTATFYLLSWVGRWLAARLPRGKAAEASR